MVYYIVRLPVGLWHTAKTIYVKTSGSESRPRKVELASVHKKRIPICDGKQLRNHGNTNHATSKYRLSRDFLFAFMLVWNLILASFVSARSNEQRNSLLVVTSL